MSYACYDVGGPAGLISILSRSKCQRDGYKDQGCGAYRNTACSTRQQSPRCSGRVGGSIRNPVDRSPVFSCIFAKKRRKRYSNREVSSGRSAIKELPGAKFIRTCEHPPRESEQNARQLVRYSHSSANRKSDDGHPGIRVPISRRRSLSATAILGYLNGRNHCDSFRDEHHVGRVFIRKGSSVTRGWGANEGREVLAGQSSPCILFTYLHSDFTFQVLFVHSAR